MRVLDGKMPAGGGAATLFIDWYGVGGRVGPGFHGVDVGARGVARREDATLERGGCDRRAQGVRGRRARLLREL